MNFQPTLFTNSYQYMTKPILSPVFHANPNSSILPKLCQALKLSLQAFIYNETNKKAPQPEKTIKQKKQPQIAPEIIELLSSDEEVQKYDSKMDDNKKEIEGKNKLEIKQIEEKTDLSKDHVDFQRESDRTHQLSSYHIRKTCLIRKQKFNKTGIKLRKQKYCQIEQNIDWTETANIPCLPLSAQQLQRKRQALILRKVFNWDDAFHSKKERREIRMLKN